MVCLSFDTNYIYLSTHGTTSNQFRALVDDLRNLPIMQRTYLPVIRSWRIDRSLTKQLENILCKHRYLGALSQLLHNSQPIEFFGL